MLIKKLKMKLSQMKCNHEYQYLSQCKIDGGMTKVITYKCSKCGKKYNHFI